MKTFKASELFAVGLSGDRETFDMTFKDNASDVLNISMPSDLMDNLFLALSEANKQIQQTDGMGILVHALTRWDVALSLDKTDVYLTFRVAEGYEIAFHIPRSRLPDFQETLAAANGDLPANLDGSRH